MNVLVLGARIIGVKLAEDMVKAYLGAKFTNEDRHVTAFGESKSSGNRSLRWRFGQVDRPKSA